MGETLTTIFVILLAAVLIFGYPMISISSKNDEIAQQSAQAIVTEYVNGIAESGIMTEEGYEKLESKLAATGNSYDIQIELRISDKNPGKKDDNQKQGDTEYYSLYNAQIMIKLPDGIKLKQGDFIKVSVKNTNPTIFQMFLNVLYGLLGNESYAISVQYSSPVFATGNI